MLHAADVAVRRCFRDGRAVQLALRDREQRVVDQGRFTGAGDAGHAGKQADRQRQRHILQVVAARAGNLQHLVRIGGHALFRHFDFSLAAQVLAGQRFLYLHNLVGGAFRHDLTAVHARAGPISII